MRPRPYLVKTKINTVVHFPLQYKTKIVDGRMITELQESNTIGFVSLVNITGDEYLLNKWNLENYLISQLKLQPKWNENIKAILKDNEAGREYSIDIYLSKEPNNPEFKYER